MENPTRPARQIPPQTGNLKGSADEEGRGWFERHFNCRKSLGEQVLCRRTIGITSPWDYLGYTGTVALFLVGLQLISGLLLLFFYVPHPDLAFASLQAMREHVPFGMLITGIHSINAKMLVLVLFIHMLRAVVFSAHRGPREPHWYSGAALLFFMMLAGLSGYVLPWSQQSYWAGVITTEAARAAPLVGDALVSLLRGGENVGGPLLHRAFALHVFLLPVAVVLLAWFHLRMVWRTGVSAPPDVHAKVREEDCIGCGECEQACVFGAMEMAEKEGVMLPRVDEGACNACRACEKACLEDCITFESRQRPFFFEPLVPHSLVHRLQAVTAALMVLFFCVFFMQGTIMRDKAPADPLDTPEVIRPEWYFMAAYQVLEEMPSESAGLLAVLAAALLVLFLPVVDKKRSPREPRRRPVYILLVAVAVILFVMLAVRGYL